MAWHDFEKMRWLKDNPVTLFLRFKDIDGNPQDWTGATGKAQIKTTETVAAYTKEVSIDATNSVLDEGLIAFTFPAADIDALTAGNEYFLGIHLTPSGGSEGSYARGEPTIVQNVTKGSAP